jgi:hypothetical protein
MISPYVFLLTLVIIHIFIIAIQEDEKLHLIALV